MNNKETGVTAVQESYIIFEVAGAAYAAPSAQVMMLEMVETITRVPNAPEFVEGVAAVRGQILPVISVRRRFHMPPIPLDIRARLVVIRLGERQVGMLVDTAREFVRISSDQIHPAEGLSGPGVEYLEGVATLPNRLILLVSLERLLSFEDRQALAARDNDLAPKNMPIDSENTASPVNAAARKRSRKG